MTAESEENTAPVSERGEEIARLIHNALGYNVLTDDIVRVSNLARQIAALQGSEGGHAGKLESAPTGGAAHLLGGERRFEHELKTWPRYFDALVDATKTFEVRQNDRAFEVGDTLWLREYRPGFGEGVYTGRELRRRVTYILHGGEFGIAAGHVVMGLATLPEPPSPAKQAPEAPPFTAERSSPHEQNTPSTPPDTPEGVSEAEAAMKEIFAKHGPALREALRPFQTLPAIGDEVVEAIRQMILVEEAEQTRLRSMPSAYSWNKVAVVDGKLDVLRKLSALHQAGKLPAETDMALLRRLVDLTYGFAMEDQSVPSTKVALALIEQAQDDVRDGPKDGLTMKDRLHMRGVNYTPPNSNGERG